jgi:hypothetical protein
MDTTGGCMDLLRTIALQCPYCGEQIEIVVDCSISQQEYVEDCSVCCNPIVLSIMALGDGEIEVEARAENE